MEVSNHEAIRGEPPVEVHRRVVHVEWVDREAAVLEREGDVGHRRREPPGDAPSELREPLRLGEPGDQRAGGLEWDAIAIDDQVKPLAPELGVERAEVRRCLEAEIAGAA